MLALSILVFVVGDLNNNLFLLSFLLVKFLFNLAILRLKGLYLNNTFLYCVLVQLHYEMYEKCEKQDFFRLMLSDQQRSTIYK